MTPIKTWQERNKELVGYANFPALMQAEIDGLRAAYDAALADRIAFAHWCEVLEDALRADSDRWKHINNQAIAVEKDSTKPNGNYFWRVAGGALPSAPTFTESVDAARSAS